MKARTHRAADGVEWTVSVVLPGSSNAMVLFRHPDGATSRLDRYNWFISAGPEARSVTTRLSPEAVLQSLDSAAITRLFERSMPITKN